jgi:hypothetical protein
LYRSLDPLWKRFGKNWNEILPTKADLKALYNVCQHSNGDKCMLINGFDFVLHDKPCIYYNYEQPQLKKRHS